MKKLIRNMVLATLLLLAGMPTKVQAQTTLTYSAPSAVAGSKDDGSESKAIIIANVKTGERLNFGGLWGTQPMTHEVGMPLYLVKGTETASGNDTNGTYYKIGTNTYADGKSTPGYIGYIRPTTNDQNTSTGTSTSWNHMFADRSGLPGYDGIVRMIFTQVNTDATNPIYTISFKYHNDYAHTSAGAWQNVTDASADPTNGIYYLTATGDDNAVVEAYKDGTTPIDSIKEIGASNEYCQWQIIAEEDLIAYFASTNDDGQTETVSATFLIDDQNFNRKSTHETSWTKSNTSIGCGLTNADASSQETYGAYWVARIDGEGYVYQEITVPTDEDGKYLPGWYQVRVKGFSTVASTAEVFISYGASNPITGTNTGYSSSSLNQLAYFSTATADITDTNSDDYAAVIKQLGCPICRENVIGKCQKTFYSLTFKP